MKRIFFCVMLALALSACRHSESQTAVTEAAAKAPASVASPKIKDSKLGDGVALLKIKFSNTQCFPGDKGGILTESCIVTGVSYGETDGILQTAYVNDKLVSVTIDHIDRTKFELISNALVSKYGQPLPRNLKPAMASASELVWQGPHWMLVATPSDQRGESGVTLIDTDFMAQAMKQRTAEAASDM